MNVVFTPKYAGPRLGAVVLTDSGGNVLGLVYLNGVGTGPQVAFDSINDAQSAVGTLDGPYGVAVDAAGNVFIGDVTDAVVYKVTPGGTQTTAASGFSQPFGVAVDGAGNLYVADYGLGQVFVVTPGGVQTTLGAGFNSPTGVAVDGAGNAYVVASGDTAVYKVTPSGVQTTVGSGYENPWGVTVDAAGNVYVADQGGFVDKITPGGTQTTIGTGWSQPYDVAVDAAGDVYVADINNGAFEVTAGGVQSMFNGPNLYAMVGVALDGLGNVYFTSNAGPVTKIDRSDGPQQIFPTATDVGNTDIGDGAMTVLVDNIGNTALTLTALSYPIDFPQNTGGANLCTGTTSLTEGSSCNLSINFAPMSVGSPLSENVTLTDNTLNASPGVTQSIPVSGTGDPTVTIAKAFGAASISPGDTTSLTITLTNFFSVAETGLTFRDNFPSGMTVANPNGLTNTCGGTASASPFETDLRLSNGSLNANASCTVVVNVTSSTLGLVTNTTDTLSFTGGTGSTASATLTVVLPPGITSADSTTYQVGVEGAFTVTTTGYPPPAITETGALPGGVTLIDQGNGTAILAGVPVLGSDGTYPIMITANNGVGTQAQQSFTLTVTPPDSLVVNNTGDDSGTDFNVNCTPNPTGSGAGSCSLRDALLEAASLGAATITFDSSVFVPSQTITLTSGTLTGIPANTSIMGPGSGVTVTGSGIAVFTVGTNTVASISNLTISGATNTGANGGAISNAGTLTVSNSTLSGNSAQDGGARSVAPAR